MFSLSRSLLFLLLTVYPGLLLHAQESNQQLTFVRGEDIILFDADSGTETVLLADVNPAHRGSSWSPDGSRLAFMVGDSDYHRELTVLDTSSAEIYQPAMASDEMQGASIGAYSWSPDGQWIAYNLYYYDPEHEQEVNEFYVIAVSGESHPQLIGSNRMDFRWMPDSHHLLYGGTGGYYRYDIATGLKEPLPSLDLDYQSWSPDGSQVLDLEPGLYIGENDMLWLYDVETGEKSHIAEDYRLLSAKFSPDGQWIDYISDTRYWGEKMSLVHRPTGEEKWLDVPRISFQQWSPDSSMIAYTLSKEDHARPYSPGGALYIFDIETGEKRLIADEAFDFIGWSPDSRWLTYQTDDDLNLVDLSRDRIMHIMDIDFVIGWRP
jgi:Tol biopolymer transport system component